MSIMIVENISSFLYSLFYSTMKFNCDALRLFGFLT